jgi:hypothetical protein
MLRFVGSENSEKSKKSDSVKMWLTMANHYVLPVVTWNFPIDVKAYSMNQSPAQNNRKSMINSKSAEKKMPASKSAKWIFKN